MSEPITLSEEQTAKVEDEQLDVAHEEDNQDEVRNTLRKGCGSLARLAAAAFLMRAREPSRGELELMYCRKRSKR